MCRSDGSWRKRATQVEQTSDAARLARNSRRRPRERGWHMNLFSVMTLWETTKVFLSKLVSSEVPNSNKPDDEELEMAVFEVSRAYFMVPSARGRTRGRNPAAVDVRVQNGYCELAKRLEGDTQRGWFRCWSGNPRALLQRSRRERSTRR